jgi:hypothetical protein
MNSQPRLVSVTLLPCHTTPSFERTQNSNFFSLNYFFFQRYLCTCNKGFDHLNDIPFAERGSGQASRIVAVLFNFLVGTVNFTIHKAVTLAYTTFFFLAMAALLGLWSHKY